MPVYKRPFERHEPRNSARDAPSGARGSWGRDVSVSAVSLPGGIDDDREPFHGEGAHVLAEGPVAIVPVADVDDVSGDGVIRLRAGGTHLEGIGASLVLVDLGLGRPDPDTTDLFSIEALRAGHIQKRPVDVEVHHGLDPAGDVHQLEVIARHADAAGAAAGSAITDAAVPAHPALIEEVQIELEHLPQQIAVGIGGVGGDGEDDAFLHPGSAGPRGAVAVQAEGGDGLLPHLGGAPGEGGDLGLGDAVALPVDRLRSLTDPVELEGVTGLRIRAIICEDIDDEERGVAAEPVGNEDVLPRELDDAFDEQADGEVGAAVGSVEPHGHQIDRRIRSPHLAHVGAVAVLVGTGGVRDAVLEGEVGEGGAVPQEGGGLEHAHGVLGSTHEKRVVRAELARPDRDEVPAGSRGGDSGDGEEREQGVQSGHCELRKA